MTHGHQIAGMVHVANLVDNGNLQLRWGVDHSKTGVSAKFENQTLGFRVKRSRQTLVMKKVRPCSINSLWLRYQELISWLILFRLIRANQTNQEQSEMINNHGDSSSIDRQTRHNTWAIKVSNKIYQTPGKMVTFAKTPPNASNGNDKIIEGICDTWITALMIW